MGITLPQVGQQATRENVVRMAQNAEKEGFDSLWVFERLLWPINPQTPYPGHQMEVFLLKVRNRTNKQISRTVKKELRLLVFWPLKQQLLLPAELGLIILYSAFSRSYLVYL